MTRFIQRSLVALSLLTTLLSGASTQAGAAPWQSKVDPWVLQTASEGETEFLVFLTTQADLSAAAALPTKLEKGTYVFQTLTSVAARTQKGLVTALERLGVDYRPYWIVNAIWVRGTMSTIQHLAERSDVAHLYANPHVALEAPKKAIPSGPQSEGIEWNITQVGAPDVWALGYTGQGVVIGGQDTGYDWDHPALKNHYRGWDGLSVSHDYNWFDTTAEDSPTPVDPVGHGTHTMGTMVGDDGVGNQIGMAPGARWIGCRNMDKNGDGTPQTYIGCYEWFVAPTRVDGSVPDPAMAPDVINNSWSCPSSEGCTDPNVLLTAVENLVAAGIVTAHSAGNSGSLCSTVNKPAGFYDKSFTVGATDDTDQIADFSSRGPVTVDGSNRLKPDISAPGVNIRSSVPDTDYQEGWSGTSMAAPHVAGLVALLISAQPELRGHVDQIEHIIEQSALHIASTECSSNGTPNNVYGWGRIDALSAYRNIQLITLDKSASSYSALPGDYITYTLAITHSASISPTSNVILTDTIPTGTEFVSATYPFNRTGDTIRWDFPDLDPQETVSVDLVVQVDITATGTITNEAYSVRSDEVVPIFGAPVTTRLEKLHFLELSKLASTPITFSGNLITYTLTVTNHHALIDTTNVVLTDTLPVGTSFISATQPYTLIGESIHWSFPILGSGDTLSVDLVVRLNGGFTGSLVNEEYGAYSDHAAMVYGAPVSTSVGRVFYLPLAIRSP